KTLSATPDTYVQSIDYRYNIRGWLTSINNAELTNTPLTNDDTDDLFGMELLYNNEDPALGNSVQFNGNISAVKWKSPVFESNPLDDRKGYNFEYDAMNRLRTASYHAYTPLNGWNFELNVFNESLEYDLNGNIQKLWRNKGKAGTVPFSVEADPID